MRDCRGRDGPSEGGQRPGGLAPAREDEAVHGAPSERGGGAVELRPIRAWSCGLSAERLAGYVDRLNALLRYGGAAAGAMRSVWH